MLLSCLLVVSLHLCWAVLFAVTFIYNPHTFFVLHFRHLDSSINSSINISNDIYLFTEHQTSSSKRIWSIFFWTIKQNKSFPTDRPTLAIFWWTCNTKQKIYYGLPAWKYGAFVICKSKDTGYLTRTDIVILKQTTMSNIWKMNIFLLISYKRDKFLGT